MPAVGVHNYQVFRADRNAGHDSSDVAGFTYRHAPMLCRWRGTWWLEAVAGPVHEHQSPCVTTLSRSDNGRDWSPPVVAFDSFRVPPRFGDVTTKAHQRMGFFLDPDTDRLLVLAHQGLPPDPNDGRGIVRVVREVLDPKSITLGPIYAIRYSQGSTVDDVPYPFYKTSADAGFVAACDRLLASPLVIQQWWEEDRFAADKPFGVVIEDGPAGFGCQGFCSYKLPDGRIVGFWKGAWATVAEKWVRGQIPPPSKMNGIIYHGAKAWGERLSDGRYAMVYNPVGDEWKKRYPLALIRSENGLDYTGPLLAVHGELPPPRYAGRYKDAGPQYVRGDESNQPDGDLWLTYSMNKEDLWVACVPVSVASEPRPEKVDDFAAEAEAVCRRWNIYSPLAAPVRWVDGALQLSDADPWDYAKTVRMFPPRRTARIAIVLSISEAGDAPLEIELVGGTGGARPVRLHLDPHTGRLTTDGMMDLGTIHGRTELVIECDLDAASAAVSINGGASVRFELAESAQTLARLELRTGPFRQRDFSRLPVYENYLTDDLPESVVARSVFRIHRVQIG